MIRKLPILASVHCKYTKKDAWIQHTDDGPRCSRCLRIMYNFDQVSKHTHPRI